MSERLAKAKEAIEKEVAAHTVRNHPAVLSQIIATTNA
jgi:hypothetical protein